MICFLLRTKGFQVKDHKRQDIQASECGFHHYSVIANIMVNYGKTDAKNIAKNPEIG